MSASKPSCHKQGTLRAPQQTSALISAQALLQGTCFPELSALEHALFTATARWLDESVSRPHPDLGRAGDVCPWTRRTLQLQRLFITSISSSDPEQVDTSMLHLLLAFQGLENRDSALATFRAIVVVFPTLAHAAGAELIVAAHKRLKPAFLRQRMMLGEFYPGCPKPGLHNPSFRPLEAPHPLLVIRGMVEPDLWFLTDEDAFVDFYLDAFGARGLDNLRQLLREPGQALSPEHVSRLRRRFNFV